MNTPPDMMKWLHKREYIWCRTCRELCKADDLCTCCEEAGGLK